MRNIVFIFAIFVVLSTCAGCSTVSHYVGPGWADRMDNEPEQKFILAETAWHTLNALDTMQTVHIASSPECFSETNFMTREIIGEHPSKGEAIAVGVVYSLAFHYVGRWLKRKAEDDSDWQSVRTGWTVFSLASKIFTVGHNHAIGLRPNGSGCRG